MATASMPTGEPPPNYMRDLGARLVEYGYHILPIIPEEKAPGKYHIDHWRPYAGWSKHCERETKTFEISIWSRWPSCAIGVACGNVAGVDIDIGDDPDLAIRIEQLARKMLGDTDAVRIGHAPKRLLVYRTTEPFKKIKKGVIEVLCDGQQFVAYGIHQDTKKPYQWPFDEIADTPVDCLPEINEEKARAFVDAAYDLLPERLRTSRLGPDMSGEFDGPYGDLKGTFDAVKAALDFIPNNDLHYDDWVKVGLAIKGALGDDGLPLWREWSARSSKSGSSGKADTPGKVWAGFRPTRIGAGSIYWYAEQNGWIPESHLILNGHVADVVTIVPDPAAAFIEKQKAAAENKAAQELVEDIPPHDSVQDVEGVLKDMVDWITNSAPRPQPLLALAASVTALGAVMGRRYRSRTDIRTNIYALGLLDSGGGKDHARKCIKEALFAASLSDYLGGNRIASGQAILTSLYKHPIKMFQIDEFGMFVRGLGQRNPPRYVTEISSTLLELYSSASGVFQGAEYANQDDRPREDIIDPCLAIYGVTAPKTFWGALESGAMHDGTLARFLVFEPDEAYPDKRSVGAIEVPLSIVAGMQAIIRGPESEESSGQFTAINKPMIRPTVFEVPETAEAQEALERLSLDETAWLREQAGTGTNAIIARFFENSMKLALVRAIAANPNSPVIRETDVMWARTVVENCIMKLIKSADRFIADNETEAGKKKILDVIARAGDSGITRSDLGQAVRSMRRRERIEAIQDLMDEGAIIARTFKGDGPDTQKFWINLK